ncbi:MAG: type II secretion system F family protein [Candidatus Firestonebacteria bacterium]
MNKSGIKKVFLYFTKRLNFFYRPPVKLHDLSSFVRQLATMLSAGVTLYQTLVILYDGLGESNLKRAIFDIKEKIKRGTSFSQCLSFYPDIFPTLLVGLVKVGEMTGGLDLTLTKYADLLEWEEEFKSKMATMLIYPAIMILIGTVVVVFILTFILPKFVVLFTDYKQALPWPTLILMGLSKFFANFWWLILVLVVGAAIFLNIFFKTENGKKQFDKMILNLPLIGNAIHKSLISRFSFILSVMSGSGVPILQALSTTSESIGNRVLSGYLSTAAKNVERGDSLSNALKDFSFFPKPVIQMIRVGEETGKIENVLTKIARSYEREMEIITRRIVILLEPIVILCLAVVVGFVAIAVLLPILSLSTVVK